MVLPETVLMGLWRRLNDSESLYSSTFGEEKCAAGSRPLRLKGGLRVFHASGRGGFTYTAAFSIVTTDDYL
jgi:hypothetical protein